MLLLFYLQLGLLVKTQIIKCFSFCSDPVPIFGDAAPIQADQPLVVRGRRRMRGLLRGAQVIDVGNAHH